MVEPHPEEPRRGVSKDEVAPYPKPASRKGPNPSGKPKPYIALALSVTAWVQAPSGALVITGSEPPESSVCTVRS